MSGGGGGGGPSIIAAYAVVRNLIRPGRSARDDDERAELDSVELSQVEYESMGLPAPQHPPRPPARFALLRRFLGR